MAAKECEEPGCANERNPHAGYRRCMRCYQSHRRAGTLNKLKPTNLHAATAEEKFYRMTTATKSCWWWEGPVNQSGYGVLTHDYQSTYAHRWSWEHLMGAIPEGFTIDHLCANKLCVNPEHLETVSIAVNSSRRHGNRVFCPRGHSLDDAYERPDGDGRQCLTCVRERRKRAWANRKMIPCERCGQVLSDVNMRAHQNKSCQGGTS